MTIFAQEYKGIPLHNKRDQSPRLRLLENDNILENDNLVLPEVIYIA